jgi:hypothetical protein
MGLYLKCRSTVSDKEDGICLYCAVVHLCHLFTYTVRRGSFGTIFFCISVGGIRIVGKPKSSETVVFVCYKFQYFRWWIEDFWRRFYDHRAQNTVLFIIFRCGNYCAITFGRNICWISVLVFMELDYVAIFTRCYPPCSWYIGLGRRYNPHGRGEKCVHNFGRKTGRSFVDLDVDTMLWKWAQEI